MSDSLLYHPRTLALVADRGFDADQHRAALASGDEDLIGLTHPINWLTEEEAEALTNCSICRSPNLLKPPHYASSGCESGGRTHCSCDVCF